MSIDHPPSHWLSPLALPDVAPLHRFSVAEYHRLAETGVFQPEARVELLDGWLVDS
jgi:hypothetical protein